MRRRRLAVLSALCWFKSERALVALAPPAPPAPSPFPGYGFGLTDSHFDADYLTWPSLRSGHAGEP